MMSEALVLFDSVVYWVYIFFAHPFRKATNLEGCS